MGKARSEFILAPNQIPEPLKRAPITIGKTYASPLSSFIGGIIAGMLIMYILIAILAR